MMLGQLQEKDVVSLCLLVFDRGVASLDAAGDVIFLQAVSTVFLRR
jgi:hypothetical protein